MHTDEQLRDYGRSILGQMKQTLERDGFVRMTVILKVPDGSEYQTNPTARDYAGIRELFGYIADAARRLNAIAAFLCYDGVFTPGAQPGDIREPGLPLGEDEYRCLVVALKAPEVPEWTVMVPYGRDERGVAYLDPVEHEGCAAPLIPDWTQQAAPIN